MATSVANVMFTNAVYFPNYKIYSGASPGMLNYGCISHVFYAFASVAVDGSVFVSEVACALSCSCLCSCFGLEQRSLLGASALTPGFHQLSDEWADAQAPCDGVQGGLGSLMHLKQAHPHLQVILSVGGGNSSEVFPVLASDALLRDNFGRSARGLVEASGFDGIDSKPPFFLVILALLWPILSFYVLWYYEDFARLTIDSLSFSLLGIPFRRTTGCRLRGFARCDSSSLAG